MDSPSSRLRFTRTRERQMPQPRRNNDEEMEDVFYEDSDEQAAFLYDQGVAPGDISRLVEHKEQETVLCPVCLKAKLLVRGDGTSCPFCLLHLNTFNPFAVRDAVLENLKAHNTVCNGDAKVWVDSMGKLVIVCPKCEKVFPVKY